MNEVGAIYLPNYSLTNLLQKDHLLELIEKDPEMNCYIPDTGYKNSISREFMLSVHMYV